MHRGTIEVYDRNAQRWSETRSGVSCPEGASDRLAAARVRSIVGDGMVLDLGCGPGRLFDAIGAPMIGVDASVGMLTLARARWTVPLTMAELEVLPFASGAVAAVFGNFSFQHLPVPGFVRAVGEAARVVRAGGVIQLAVHAGDFEGDDRPGDDLPGRWFTYWEEGPLTASLVAAGLEILDVATEPRSLRVTAVKLAA